MLTSRPFVRRLVATFLLCALILPIAWFLLAQRGLSRPIPRIPWSVWALLGAAVILIPLLVLMRNSEGRDLFQKCILFSLLVHIVLTMMFSAVHVSRQIVHYVREEIGMEIGMEIPLNLQAARLAEVQLRIRDQITDDANPPPPAEAVPMASPQITFSPPTDLGLAIPRGPAADGAMVINTAPPISPPANVPEEFKPAPATPQLELPAVEIKPLAPLAQPDSPIEMRAPAILNSPTIDVAPAAELLRGQVPIPPTRHDTGLIIPSLAPPPPVLAAKDPRQLETTFTPTIILPASSQSILTTAPAQNIPRSAPTREIAISVPRPGNLLPSKLPSDITPSALVHAPPTLPESAPIPSISPALEITTPDIRIPSLQAAPTPAPTPDIPKQPRTIRIDPPPSPKEEKLRPKETLLSVDPVTNTSVPFIDQSRLAPQSTPNDTLALQIKTSALTAHLGPPNLLTTETLSQRKPEMRQPLVENLGGSKQSEDAVNRALAWLVANQEPDGRWTRFTSLASPRGSQRSRNDNALTGLAVLCFLSANHHPASADSPYRSHATRGLEFLLDQQKKDGDLRSRGNMYDHAIAALALGEAGLMTGDTRYKSACLRAADFILYAQNEQTGAWQYHPHEFGDTSLVAWQLMALHSAERLGFQTPARTRAGAQKWLDRVSSGAHNTLAGYQNRGQPTPSMTAQAVLSRLLLNQSLSQAAIREASDFITRDAPPVGETNYYYWYAASLTLMQFQNDAWTKWNLRTREQLLKLQRDNGSFDPDQKWSDPGGRVYSTAMATLTLEVYYRYLPLYSR